MLFKSTKLLTIIKIIIVLLFWLIWMRLSFVEIRDLEILNGLFIDYNNLNNYSFIEILVDFIIFLAFTLYPITLFTFLIFSIGDLELFKLLFSWNNIKGYLFAPLTLVLLIAFSIILQLAFNIVKIIILFGAPFYLIFFVIKHITRK